ncbi:hypothetical protein T4B_6659 [Trichinella pseudospiralis]|uniref:DUF7107 domain-containing protein n=1 Tax=Trichinella pseudospiralis TaxID=6337 RepID=A0A0V1JGQ4_TRIPS|nr:hypothetical protein T4B_6659 [Trichinella pseudospiralis]
MVNLSNIIIYLLFVIYSSFYNKRNDSVFPSFLRQLIISIVIEIVICTLPAANCSINYEHIACCDRQLKIIQIIEYSKAGFKMQNLFSNFQNTVYVPKKQYSMSSSFILNHDETVANNTLDFTPDERYKLLYHCTFIFLNGYSIGLGTFSLSLLLRYVNRIYYYSEDRKTALECLLSSPWMTLYMPSVLFLNFCMLFLSIDQLLTMISLTKLKSERKRTVMHQLILSAVTSALSAVWLWTSAFLNSNKLLSKPGCNFSSVVTFSYNVILHFFCALMGYFTIFIFLCIFLLLWKHHKNTLVASTVRYKRAVAVTKRVSLMVLMTFILQSIPITFTIVYYFTKQGLKLRDFSWISESICFPFAAVFFIFSETRLAQWGYGGFNYGGYGYDGYGYGSYGYGNPYPSGFYQQSPFIVQQLPSYTSGNIGDQSGFQYYNPQMYPDYSQPGTCTSQADCGNKSLFCVSGQCQSMEPTTQKCSSNEECPSGICKARFCWGPPGGNSQTPDQQQPDQNQDQNQNTQQPGGHCNTQDDCSATQMCSKVTPNTCVKGYSIEITCSSDSDCDKKDACKAGTCWKEGEPGGGEPGDPCKDHGDCSIKCICLKKKCTLAKPSLQKCVADFMCGKNKGCKYFHCWESLAIAYFVVHVQNLALLKHMTEDNSTEEFPVIIGAIIRIFEKHRAKNYQKHITGYSFGIVLLSLSMILHDLKITEFKSNELPSTMECLRKNLWVTFYISGQLLITLFMLFLCVDQLRAVIYLKRPNMPTSRLANISVFIIVCVTAIVASWPWISSFWISGNSSTSKNCILFKTIVEKFYVTLQITFVVFDMVTVCLYSTIVAILLKEHKNSVLVPLAKLRRASTIAKRIMIPLIFTVFLQTIPNLVAIFHYYLRNCRQLRNIFWEVKATFFPFSALLFFFTQTNLGKCWLEKAKAFFYKYFHREQRQQQVSTVATVAKCS